MISAEKEFIRYTNSYRKYGEKILLKIEHTLRVESLCKELAASLGLTADDIELSAVCGLLHDIGRFEQWQRYKTYNDLRSIDHADLGAAVLLENDLITAFSKTDHNTILKAVKYHNKFRVPNTLNKRNRLFANITRDADKTDILFLYSIGGHINRTENDVISNSAYKALINNKIIRTQHARKKDDDIAIRLGFVFDINYRRSFEIIKENDYINNMIDIQIEKTTNPKLEKQLSFLRKHINCYIEEKIKKADQLSL